MLSGSSFLRSFGFPLLLAGFAPSHFGHPLARIHGAAAFGRAAVAGGWVFVIVKVVVPNQFFAGGDVADREKPGAALDLVDFAVGIAGMVQKGAEPFPVDHRLAVL